MVFYGLNGISLDAPDEDAYDLVIAIASGATTQIEALAAALSTWHRVRQESEVALRSSSQNWRRWHRVR